MNGSRRKALFVLAGMGLAAALAKAGVPTKKIADTRETDLEKMFPAQFGDWQVDRSSPVILPAPDVQARLDAIYNQVLARSYINQRSGERLMLSVAYGGDQSDGTQVHLPEVCYPAQGFEVIGQRLEVLSVDGTRLPLKRVQTKLGSRYEPITYWMTLGESVVATRTDMKLQQMAYGIRGFIPDGMLIRVSTIGRNFPSEYEVHDRFIRDLYTAMNASTKPRVFGSL